MKGSVSRRTRVRRLLAIAKLRIAVANARNIGHRRQARRRLATGAVVTAGINHALEAAIHRAHAIGRVDVVDRGRRRTAARA